MKKDRTNQRGQALIYFGIFGLVFFSLAALAVDVGWQVFVGREAQVVADATALAGATALGRGGDATVAATTFPSQETLGGQAASPGSSRAQVGKSDRGGFTAGSCAR